MLSGKNISFLFVFFAFFGLFLIVFKLTEFSNLLKNVFLELQKHKKQRMSKHGGF